MKIGLKLDAFMIEFNSPACSSSFFDILRMVIVTIVSLYRKWA